MRAARSRRLIGARTHRRRSGRQGSDQPATLAPQITARLKALTRARALVRSSHATDDPSRKVSNAPARRVGPSAAARFPRKRPALPVHAKVSHNAAPAPRSRLGAAPLRRASAVHVRRANSSTADRRANPSAADRRRPLTGNRTLDARAARGLRGSTLATAGATSQRARPLVGAPQRPVAVTMGTAARGRVARLARRRPLCSSAAPAGMKRELSTGGRNRSLALPGGRPLRAMARRSRCGSSSVPPH